MKVTFRSCPLLNSSIDSLQRESSEKEGDAWAFVGLVMNRAFLSLSLSVYA